MISLRYLIVGTGRSGTVSLAKLLTKAGIACGHETVFDILGSKGAEARLNGTLPLTLSYCSTHQRLEDRTWKELPLWLYDLNSIRADASYMAVPFIQQFKEQLEVIHVVRNPIKVVHSFCNSLWYFQTETPQNEYEEFIYKYVPELTQKIPRLDRGCLYYVRWTQKILKHVKDVYRVEQDLPKLFQHLGIVVPEELAPDEVNSLKSKAGPMLFAPNMIESDLIRSEFVELTKQLGYEVKLNYLFL